MKLKILSIILASLILFSCNSAHNHEDEENHQHEHKPENVVILNENQVKALNLKLGSFIMRNLTTVVKTTGQLTVPPESQAEITAIIGGNVKEIRVFFGDFVKKGQILGILEHPNYIQLQEDFAQIASQLEFLKQDYERQKKLYEQGATPAKKFQEAKAKYFATKAKYEGLRKRLILLNIDPEKVKQGQISSSINIIAPIDGYITQINVKVGSFVNPDEVMFVISNTNNIHADLLVYEKDIHLIKPGQKVHFTVANKPGLELTGKIFAIEKEFDPDIRVIHVHATIEGDKTGLIPGMYITGHIHTDSIYTQTLPNDAIVREGTKYYIFIYDPEALHQLHQHPEEDEEKHKENNETSEKLYAFRMVEIIPGKQDDGYTEVKLIHPLDPDTKIVLNNAYYLLADMKKEETEHSH